MKRFLYFLLIVGIIALIVLVGYFLRYRNEGSVDAPETPETSGGFPTPPGGSPPTPPGDEPQSPSEPQPVLSPTALFGLVVQNPVNGYFVDTRGDITIVQPEGQVIHIAKSGQSTILSSTRIANLIQATFSSDGQKILASFGNIVSPEHSIFDIKTKTWTPLDTDIQNPSWSPLGQQIIYFRDKKIESVLETMDVSKGVVKPKEIMRLRIQDAIPVWANANLVFIQEKSSSLVGGSLWSLDMRKKTLGRLFSDEFGLLSLWNASGTQGLVFTGGGRGGNLALVDNQGKTTERLAFLTLPSKCLFATSRAVLPPAGVSSTIPKTSTSTAKAPASAEVLYCAIPRDTETLGGSALPDDYQKKILFTADDFHKIDLSNGSIKTIFNNAQERIDAENLQMASGRLFFVNRFDEKLYSLLLAD